MWNVKIYNSDFSNCDLSGVDLRNAVIVKSKFNNATITNAKIPIRYKKMFLKMNAKNIDKVIWQK
jgi:uncharacterized protein YjbI with pentapeptide repeats